MATLPALVPAVTTLTSTGVFVDTQTITIGGKVYTSQTTLTNVDGNFFIGADQTASHLNLMRAVNLGIAGDGTGAGTLYAAAMTKNTQVKATSADGTHTVFAAKIKGTIGNQIATTETQTNASFTSTVMASGTGDALTAIDNARGYAQINSEVAQILDNALNFTVGL